MLGYVKLPEGKLWDEIHSINGVSSVLITGIWGLNCKQWFVLHLDLLMGTNRWTKQALHPEPHGGLCPARVIQDHLGSGRKKPWPLWPLVKPAAKRCIWIPSGELSHNYGKSPFLMGKLTINGHFQLLC